MEIKLKPCPFCNGTDIYITESWPHYAFCLGCGAKMQPPQPLYGEEAIEKVAEAWNRRENK